MKFTLSWLKQHLDTDSDLPILIETLFKIGLEVESVEDKSAHLKDFLIAKIVEATPHPKADRLRVCLVNTGETALKKVVCGASNARTGMVGVFAPLGVTIPSNGAVLKLTKIRGIDSAGMMCSSDELLLGTTVGDKIIELEDTAPIGSSFALYSNINEAVIEVGLTPNRGDCASVRGIARDLAAAGLGTLKPLPYDTIKGSFSSPITLHQNAESAKNCPFFVGRYIHGITNGPSPKKIQELLRAIGLTPVSALVDITNYITFDIGRPLHAFDAQKIIGKNLSIRQAQRNEEVHALNHATYTLDASITVVADSEKARAISGIIGDESTRCSMDTTDIFLECAYFDAEYIAKTGQNLGISTDARYCFERGIDPTMIKAGIDAATQMILEYCGGEASEVISCGVCPDTKKTIAFDPRLIEKRTGVVIEQKDILRILNALGCHVRPDVKHVIVTTPSWRHDLGIPEDIVEEIIRLKGYDAIPCTPLPALPVNPLTPDQQRLLSAKHVLANQGLSEAITWSMVDLRAMDHFGVVDAQLKITNPISADLSYMRPSLMPNLLKNARYHQDHSVLTIDMFEIEAIYHTKDTAPQYNKLTIPGQEIVAAGIRAGEKAQNHWRAKNHPVDFYYVKRDVLALLKHYGLDPNKVQWSREYLPHWYHPGQSSTLHQGKRILGHVGVIHPKTLKLYGLKGATAGFEIFWDRLPPLKEAKHRRPPLQRSAFQCVARDFSFLMKNDVLVNPVCQVIKNVSPKLISSAIVYDIYQGDDIDTGQQAVTFRVHLTPMDKTLQDAEIKVIYDGIIESVTMSTGAKFRL